MGNIEACLAALKCWKMAKLQFLLLSVNCQYRRNCALRLLMEYNVSDVEPIRLTKSSVTSFQMYKVSEADYTSNINCQGFQTLSMYDVLGKNVHPSFIILPHRNSEVSLMEPNTLYQRGFLNTLFFHILNYKKCSLTISLVTQSTDVNTDVVCSKIRYTTIGYTTIGDPGV